MKFLMFSLFLFLFLIWITASQKSLAYQQKSLIAGRLFRARQLGEFISWIGLFTFLWVLGGFLDFRIIGWVFVVTQASIILAAVIWALLGPPRVPWGAQILCEGGQHAVRHRWIPVYLSLAGLVILIGYPIAAGIEYFGHNETGPELTAGIFKTTVLWLLAGGMLSLLPSIVLLLSSPHLHEDTRARALISNLSQFVLNALYISMILWTFNLSGTGNAVELGGVELSFSPLVWTVLITYYVLVLMLPYWIGVQRGRNWRRKLLSYQTEWLARLGTRLVKPQSKTEYRERLEHFRQDLERESKLFIARFPGLAFSTALSAPDAEVPPSLQDLDVACRMSAEFDPRVRYLSSLDALMEETRAFEAALPKCTTQAQTLKHAEDFAASCERRKSELEEELRSVTSARPFVLLATSVLVALVLNPMIDWLGNVVSKILSESIPMV